jgi:anti-sigma regulatory factor (Ser/Thr protein kinase)
VGQHNITHMAARNRSPLNGHRLQPSQGPFPRFEERRRKYPGWTPVDLGGHEVISRLHLAMRPGAEAAAEARHTLDRLIGTMPDDELDTLRLLVTELITNAVRHAGGHEWVELDIELYVNAVHVAVTDRGPGFTPPECPQPHGDRPGGWGLCLVDRLSNRWGVLLDGATRVWFELDRAPQPRFAHTSG